MESPLCPGSFLSHIFLNGSRRVWRCSTTQVSPGEAWLGPDKGEEPTASPPGESVTSGPEEFADQCSLREEMTLSTGEQGRPVRFQGGATPPSLQLLPMLQGWGPDRYDFSITLSFCFPQLGHVPLSTAGHFVQTVSLPQPDKVRTVNHRINRSWTLCSSPNQNSCTAISGKVRLVPTSSWSARASRKVKVKSSWQKNHHLDYIYCFCPDPSLPTGKPQTPN